MRGRSRPDRVLARALASTAAALACFALLSAGGAAAQTVTAERPDQRVQLDFQHYYTLDELDTSLAALAAAYPEYLRLESMGRSALGHELWVLTVTRLADGDPARKPGLLLVGGLGEADLWGTELALFTVLELVQNHRRDPRVAEALAQAVLYVVPAAHPDLRAALFGSDGTRSGFESRASIDGNFEIGWRPSRPGAGPYPLSQPETFALAQFLLGRDNVAVVQTYGQPGQGGGTYAPGSPDAGLSVGAEHLLALDAASHRHVGGLAEGGSLAGIDGLPLAGGSLLEFAHGHRGAFGFATRAGGAVAGQSPDVSELFALGQRAFASSLALSRALPRMEFGPVEITRLAPELWQLDLVVENTGELPTLSALGARRYAAAPPRIELAAGPAASSGAAGSPDAVQPSGASVGDGAGSRTGPRLVASAVRSRSADLADFEGQDVFEVVPARGRGLSIEELAGGESRAVRLVIRAAEGESITLRAGSPRGGVASLELTLR